MGPLIIVSRFPPYIAVTVAEKGTPATTFGGALTWRVACDEPQLNDIKPAIAALKAHSHRTGRRLRALKRADFPEKFAEQRTRLASVLDTLFFPFS